MSAVCIDSLRLDIRGLRASFVTRRGIVGVVDDVTLRIPAGKTVVLAGESGCGKTVTALSILGLIPQPPARIAAEAVLFRDSPGCEAVDLRRLRNLDLRRIRGNRIGMVFQEPTSSLNPVQPVGHQVAEALELHRRLRGTAARRRAIELLSQMGIPDAAGRARSYPHELSGGMCQRVMIAMALSCGPSLLIADEPTTALDVTVQAQVLDVLRTTQADSGMSILLITHDLGVVAEMADEVYIMYAGRIVEHGCVEDVFARPLHPYTQGLLASMPRLSQSRKRFDAIAGTVPEPFAQPDGCRFHPRCSLATTLADDPRRNTVVLGAPPQRRVLSRCAGRNSPEEPKIPPLVELGPHHYVACWEANEGP